MVAMMKYMVIILCSAYTTRKIINARERPNLIRVLLAPLFFLRSSLIVCLLRLYIPSVSLLAMVGLSICAHMYFFHITISTSIAATIISYGITYLEYLGGVLFLIILLRVFPSLSVASEIFQAIIISLVQVSFALLLFGIKRFSHGLPFLADSQYGDLGVYLSTSVLMAVSFLGMKLPNHYITAVIAYTLFILGMILWLWYKSRITQEYWKKIREREQQELHEQIAVLKKENDALSAIIHKDNKLIPALDLSVKTFLSSVAQNDCRKECIKSAQVIIEQIEGLSSERSGAVKSYKQASAPSVKTSAPMIDALLSFMLHKAELSNVQISFSLPNEIKKLIDNVISEQDMATLLADLIDNAIIAARHSTQEKRVYVEIGKDKDEYDTFFVQVSDSGIPFSQEVLDKLGTQRITTHRDTGGSGIGMMTICEICKKCEASFSISPYTNSSLYTKAVKICFDRKNSFHIQGANRS